MNKEDIILKCRKNDRAAQTALFDMYYPVVYGIISRYIRDDDTRKEILQESFITLFTRIRQLRDVKSFDGWVRQITVHHCINLIRRNKVVFTELADEKNGHTTDDEANTVRETPDVTIEEVYAAVDELPEGYRIIFQLFAVDHLPHKEIASRLGISESTSKTQYLKARKYIRKIILQKKTHAR